MAHPRPTKQSIETKTALSRGLQTNLEFYILLMAFPLPPMVYDWTRSSSSFRNELGHEDEGFVF
jgi:hypothetical protein